MDFSLERCVIFSKIVEVRHSNWIHFHLEENNFPCLSSDSRSIRFSPFKFGVIYKSSQALLETKLPFWSGQLRMANEHPEHWRLSKHNQEFWKKFRWIHFRNLLIQNQLFYFVASEFLKKWALAIVVFYVKICTFYSNISNAPTQFWMQQILVQHSFSTFVGFCRATMKQPFVVWIHKDSC